MRFLFFSAQYLPTVGGVERYTYNLTRTLTAMGHEATVVTSALPDLPAEETAEGVRVFRLPSRLPMGGRFPVPKKNRAFREMAARIFEARYDLAVINTRFYPLSLFAAKSCKKKQIPAIVIEHGTKHLSLDNALLDIFGNAYEHLAMRRIRRHCSRFFGVSKACNDWLRHFGVDAEGVLYNAVVPTEVEAAAAAAPDDIRAVYGLPATAPIAAFSGRFIREKGIRELLNGFARFQKEHPTAFLIMAGDGPLFEAVREADPENVILAGMLPYSQSVALLRDADVFLLPTYSEGFSSVILEAAALGTPVVTTKTGGSPELIETGVSGVLLDDIEEQTIAAALSKLFSDDAFRAAAGERIRARVLERFTFDKTAEQLAKIAAAKL